MISYLFRLKKFRIVALAVTILTSALPAKILAHDFEVDGIYYKILSDTEAAVTYKGDYYQSGAYTGDIIIPSEVSFGGVTYKVTQIYYSAFEMATSLKSIKIPSSVTEIGQYAFYGTAGLERIDVDGDNPIFSSVDGVLFQDNNTICYRYPCQKKGAYTIPESVVTIRSNAFENCQYLTSVQFHSNLKEIWNEAFYKCVGLTSLELPSNLELIDMGAFSQCSNLSSVILGESLKYIRYNAFNGDDKLKTITCLGAIPPEIFYSSFPQSVSKIYVQPSSYKSFINSAWGDCFSESVFYKIPQNIEVMVEGNGKIVYEGNIISSNESLRVDNFSFIVLPDDGNLIRSLELNGINVLNDLSNHVISLDDFTAGLFKAVFTPENEASLTVKCLDTHSLTHYYKEGTKAKIDISPEKGWSLYELLFNGSDVTDDVVNNTYTTPELSGNNNLEVVMKAEESTSVNDEMNYVCRKVSFRKHGNTVEILNLDEDEAISIYHSDGVCQYQGRAHTVTLTPNAVYILRTQKETLKFAL